MALNIDMLIVVVFLVVNLAVGIYSGRGIKTIKEYAIGNRNFSTATLTATLVATWIGGGFFAIGVSQTYQDGLFYIVASVGDILALLVVAYILSGRMKEFLGKISMAEVMGELYGKHVRIISALACIAISTGAIALQLKVISSFFNHFFSLSSIYAILASSAVIIIYSAFGGIKSVTFTDTIQFLTFGTFVPIFAVFIWKAFGSHEVIIANITNSSLFDYKELFNYQNPKFFPYLTLLIYNTALTPADPSLFQRTLLAKDTNQIRKSFINAALVVLFVLIASCSIGTIIYGHNPNLDPNNLVMYIIDNYSYTGLKGIVLVGILAITMSTADSWINVASVIFSHDFCKPLKIEWEGNNELLLSRLFSVFIGLFAIILALTAHNLLDLLLLIGNFFCPIVAPILILGVLGIRSTTKAALIAICSGVLTTIIWKIYLQEKTNIDSVMPGTLANLITFLTFHFILGEKRWLNSGLSTKRNNPLKKAGFVSNFLKVARNYQALDLLAYCNKNALKQEKIYVHFGIFTILSMLCTTILLEQSLYNTYAVPINIMQIIILGLSTFLITYRLWPEEFKIKYVGLVWYISIFISSAITGSFLLLINNFSPISLMIFSINLLIMSYLLKWQEAITMLVGGIVIAYLTCYRYLDIELVFSQFYDAKFSVIYSLLMLTGSFIFFLKPKQEYQQLTEEKVTHLNGRINGQEKELREAMGIRSRFIRNIQHEYHAPMTGVMSTSETLWQAYDKLPDEQRKKAAYDIFISSLRLKAFDDNITALSKLNRAGYELRSELINLSDLLRDRIQLCRKLYEEDKEARQFILNIEEGINIDGDNKYLTQALDNIIINSINYCPQGKVTIELKRTDSEVTIIFADEGIGIPPKELEAIFDEFVVSSKTFTPAGGRGIGLAVAKRIIEAHGGKIEAESDGVKGSTFRVVFNK